MTLKTSLIFLYHLTKNLPNQISLILFKMVIFHSFLAITPVWDVIETWDFCVDDPCDFLDIPISPQKNLPNHGWMTLQTSLIFLYHLKKNYQTKPHIPNISNCYKSIKKIRVKKPKPFLSEL